MRSSTPRLSADVGRTDDKSRKSRQAVERGMEVMSETGRRNLFLALCALALLHTGANISQSYVNYPGWYVLDVQSFKAYHWPMSIRAAIFLMAPRVVEVILALVVALAPATRRRALDYRGRHYPGGRWHPVYAPHLTTDPRAARHSRQHTGARVASHGH